MKSYGKIRQSRREIKALKKALKKEQRKNKTLEEKYNDVKRKNKILKCDNKKKQRKLILSLASRKGKRNHRASIPRYRFGEIAVRYAVLLYAYGGLSSRQVPKVMELHNLIWGGLSEELPSHVTVIDWVEKCGLSTVQGSMSKKTAKEAYSLIIDNSITVCGQDLHMELKTSSCHPGHPHKQADVSVARLVVGKNWNKDATKRQLSKTIESAGCKPDYVVCDNGGDNVQCQRRYGHSHSQGHQSLFRRVPRAGILKGRGVYGLYQQERLCRGSSPIRRWPV